jgi:hypothetical protein
MALTLDQAIQRLKENEERLRQFVNDPLATGTYSTEAAQLVETLPAFLARIEADIDAYAASFKASYLGPLAADPTLDGNGNPITAGDVYFNTGSLKLRVYTGTVWQDIFATANQVTFTPAGNIAATQVQAAIEELDAEKAGLALNNTFTGVNWFKFTGGAITPREATPGFVELHIRPNAGKTGGISFTEDTVADRWSCRITPGQSHLSFSTGQISTGIERLRFLANGQIGIQSLGTAALPHLTPTGDPDTGLFSPGANLYSLSAGAQEQLRVGLSAPLRARYQSTVGTSYNTMGFGYFIRAWVNFNGTGTVAINASGNVSSITDRGAGAYRLNFTEAMPDTNYSWLSGAMSSNASYFFTEPTNKTTAGVDITRGVANAFAAADEAEVSGAIIR